MMQKICNRFKILLNEDEQTDNKILPNQTNQFKYNFNPLSQKLANPQSVINNSAKENVDATNQINKAANQAIQDTKVPISPYNYTKYMRSSVLGPLSIVSANGIKSVADFMVQLRQSDPKLEQTIATALYKNDKEKLNIISKELKNIYDSNQSNHNILNKGKNLINKIGNTMSNLTQNNIGQQTTNNVSESIFLEEMTVEESLKHKDKYGEGAKKRKKLKSAQDKIIVVMKEYNKGTLRSGGSAKKVKDKKQAIAIAMSTAGLSKDGKGKK
jgi:hypothetical protein